jgi:hypothetical protein
MGARVVIARMMRAHDAVAAFLLDTRDFGWVVVTSLRSRWRR